MRSRSWRDRWDREDDHPPPTSPREESLIRSDENKPADSSGSGQSEPELPPPEEQHLSSEPTADVEHFQNPPPPEETPVQADSAPEGKSADD